MRGMLHRLCTLVACAVVAIPFGVANARQGGTVDTGTQAVGGPAVLNPVVARNADGRLEVFAVTPTFDAIYHRWQTAPSNGWSNWAQFGGPTGGVPVVAQNADGRLEVFALSPGGSGIYHRWQTAPSNGRSNWAQFGGPAGVPVC